MHPEQPIEPVITTEPAKIDLRRRPRAVPDWSGRGMKRRLMVLVGGLLLVLILMERVRDPELWRKIGFTEQPNQKGHNNGGGRPGEWTEIRLAPKVEESDAGIGAENEQEPGGSSGETGVTGDPGRNQEPETAVPQAEVSSALETDSSKVRQSIEQLKASGDPLDRRLAAHLERLERTRLEFWFPLLDRLSAEELKSIAARVVAGEVWPEEDAAALSRAVQRLDGMVTEHSLKGLEELSREPESEARTAAIGKLTSGPVNWNESIRPWLMARPEVQDVWWGTADSIGDFQQVLRQVAYSRVEDRTGPARAEEAAAALISCQSWQGVNESGLYMKLDDTYELMTSPEVFRGKRYIFHGTLRGIEPVPFRPAVLRIESLWALWIAPDDGSVVPLCVYTPELPDELTPDTKRFTPFDLPVVVSGYFFKLRTYTDTNHQQAVCPLIHAIRIAVKQKGATGDKQSPPETLPWNQLTLWLIPLVSVAAVVSWLATVPLRKKNRFAPRGDRAALRQLELDPSIVSDRERVARLEREGT